jgi:hypothetical protein
MAVRRRRARSKPWRGTPAERLTKFGDLNRALAAAYGIESPALSFSVTDPAGGRGNGCYSRWIHAIFLFGKLSVVTYLHEFAHARGMDERQAVRWSVNLFRRCFPRSFARCRAVGHVLVNEGRS